MLAAEKEISAAAGRSKEAAKKLCQLIVYNRAGEMVGGITAETFMEFRRQYGKNIAVVVELQGEEVLVETYRLLRKFPRGGTYRARLLRKTNVIPDELAQEASGCQVWVEA